MRRSKLVILLVVFSALFLGAIALLWANAARIVQRQVRASLSDKASFQIGRISGRPWKEIVLHELRLSDAQGEFSAASAMIRFTLPGLLNRRVEELILTDVEARLVTPEEPMPKLSFGGSDAKTPGFTLRHLEIKGLTLDLKTRDLSAAGTVSFSRDLRASEFKYLDVRIPKAEIGPVSLQDITAISGADGAGRLDIGEISYQKWKVEAIRAPFKLSPNSLALSLETAEWLDVPLRGEGMVDFFPEPRFRVKILTDPLPVPEILAAFEWDKKVSVSGALSGTLEAEGTFSKLTKLHGQWDSQNQGDLVIVDQTLLERLAASSKQPLSIIKASFEKYHYNTGRIALSLDEGSVRLGIGLEGEAGKRDLEVNLHDLI